MSTFRLVALDRAKGTKVTHSEGEARKPKGQEVKTKTLVG